MPRALRRHRRARGRHRFGQTARRRGFLPAFRRLRGEALFRGQDPRLVPQARGAPVGKGRAHFPHDRPPDPPAVPERPAQRRDRRLHRDERGPRLPARNRVDGRRLHRALHLGHSVERPDLRHFRGLCGRRIRHQPQCRAAQEIPHGRHRGFHRLPHRDDRGGRRRDPRRRDVRRHHGRPQGEPGRHRVHQEYPEGYRQTEIRLPEQLARLGDAEHHPGLRDGRRARRPRHRRQERARRPPAARLPEGPRKIRPDLPRPGREDRRMHV